MVSQPFLLNRKLFMLLGSFFESITTDSGNMYANLSLDNFFVQIILQYFLDLLMSVHDFSL